MIKKLGIIFSCVGMIIVSCIGCTQSSTVGDDGENVLEENRYEDMNILASIYSVEDLRIEEGSDSERHLIVKTEESCLSVYNEVTEDWEESSLTEVYIPLTIDCKWYISSPLVFQADYSDVIESDEEEVMGGLMDEVEAVNQAKNKEEPYDTSVSMMIEVLNGKIVSVYQVSA